MNLNIDEDKLNELLGRAVVVVGGAVVVVGAGASGGGVRSRWVSRPTSVIPPSAMRTTSAPFTGADGQSPRGPEQPVPM